MIQMFFYHLPFDCEYQNADGIEWHWRKSGAKNVKLDNKVWSFHNIETELVVVMNCCKFSIHKLMPLLLHCYKLHVTTYIDNILVSISEQCKKFSIKKLFRFSIFQFFNFLIRNKLRCVNIPVSFATSPGPKIDHFVIIDSLVFSGHANVLEGFTEICFAVHEFLLWRVVR